MFIFDKIIFINQDKRKDALKTNKIIITLQTVIFNKYFILKNFDFSLNDINKVFIFEDTELNLELKDFKEHFLIHFDRNHIEETNIENVYFDDRYFIRKVLNSKNNKVRFFC